MSTTDPGAGAAHDDVVASPGTSGTDRPGDLAGVPDGFERLWTPHRMAYIGGQDKPTDADAGPGCPFCRIPSLSDEDGLVVARGETAYVVMNLYPYNSGHVLVCPYRHVADYTDLTGDEVVEVAALTQTAMRVLRAVSGPHGFNLGMNQGDVAGAGIAAHLHQHVVPRWGGDSNFLPIVGRSRALPELLGDTRARLAAAWPGAETGGTGADVDAKG
ncbi:HIT family protein [Cellulomonas algicola]|uniref:HIT family protein n=1 Tax=Cellulomonas algicola TaxID=2071633 RepID=UPI0027DECBE2|nr:HIT domain-containing protein [Cellulomonas algicola]